MPKGIEVPEEELTPKYGKFVIQPLERGFGITLGNALRRVLLSSIQGAAIDSIRIEGVHHEFSTLPNIVEDVPEIILNLKEVDIRLLADEAVQISVDIKGPKKMTAGDLAVDSRFEIVNPDHHICEIDTGGVFKADIVISDGRGYVPADEKPRTDTPVDTILIDSIFSPIRKVNYLVGNARVGQRTDYDKLTLEVWTNGTIKPADSLAYAAKVITDHLKLFINFDEEFEQAEEEQRYDPEKVRIAQLLDMPVDEMELSVRSSNCLKAAGIKNIRDLVTRSESEMLKYRNFGRKSLSELNEVLINMGLTFCIDVSEYDKELEKYEKLERQGSGR